MPLPAKQNVGAAADETPRASRLPVLPATAMTEAEFVRKTHFVKMPPGTTKEDLLRSDFWKLTGDKLNRHDIVFALADDESWEAELRVERSFGSGAEVTVVKVQKRKSFSDGSTVLGDGQFVTSYRDGGWCVLRTADQFAIVKGHATEGAAISQWLREQPRKV